MSMKITSYDRHDEGEQLNFKSLIFKYAKAWPIIAGSVCIALLLAFIVNSLTPPVYKIQSKFLIKEDGDAMNLFEETGGKNIPLPKGQKIANESIMLKSRSTAADALAQLPFDVEYYQEGILRDAEIYGKTPVSVEVDWNHVQLVNGRIRISWTDYRSFRMELLENEYQKFVPGTKTPEIIDTPVLSETTFSFGEWTRFNYGKFLVNFTGAEKSGSLTIKIRDRESLIQQYTGDNFQVVPVDKTSSILLLALDTHQPYKGQDYLNMLMKVFLDNELDEKNSVARNTVNFIDSQLAEISDSLSHSQNTLETYRSLNRTYDITTEGNTLYEKLSELEKVLSHEQFKRDYYLDLQEYLRREHYSEIVMPSGMGIDDPVLNTLMEELIRLQSDKSRFLATQTTNSPAVKEVDRKIRDLNMSIQEALKNINRNTKLLIDDLSKRIAKIESQFGKLPQTEQDLLNMKRRYSLNESIYTFLLQRRAEASITLASNTSLNKIIEPAVLNLIPIRLRPMLNYLLAALLGFIVPIGVMSVKESFYLKIGDPKEVEKRLVVPLVGCIGQNRKYPSLVVLHHPRARLTEAFRALRTNLDFIFAKQSPVTILVTSSIAGEGKSFCSANLAAVYSSCGKKTIIVGCDMHKPYSFDGFEVSDNPGLSDFLNGLVWDVKDIIQKTEYGNLDVLVPGRIPQNPVELLIGERFHQLICDLQQRYDVIVLDSSPAGLTNETLYLTRMADLTLFVLRQKYSDKTFPDDINALKEKKGIKNLYVLINDVEEQYLSYGGYGYGYYEEEEVKENVFRRVIRMISNKAAF